MESLADAMRPVVEKFLAHVENVEPPPSAGRGDSVLEERFWSLIDTTVGGREGSLDQFEIGKYRVDSIFLIPQGAVVIELDGEEYHKDKIADYDRDTKILKSVYGVIRVRYYDLMTFPKSTLYNIGRFYPRFMPRGLPTFEPHDDPRTANLLGVSWRQSGNRDKRIIDRIQNARRRAA